MSARSLLIAVTVVEVLLVAVAARGVFVAVRSWRANRAAGLDGWGAAEEGLAGILPRKVARLLLIEPRLFVSMIRWLCRKTGSEDGFGYQRGIRPLLAVIVGVLAVEGVIADVLVATLLSGPWVWLVLVVHLYAVWWFVAFYASMVVRPHEAAADALRVRDGIFAELVVPWPAVRGVEVVRRPNFGRSGFKRDPTSSACLLAVGDATVRLELDPQQPVRTPDGPIGLSTLAITVDEPFAFRREVVRRSSGVR